MRIGLDADLCQGHAMCELEAPEVFSVPVKGPAKGKARILDSSPPAALRPAVEAAVRYCPTQALKIVED